MVMVLVWRTELPALMAGAATLRLRPSLAGGVDADVPRCRPVVLAGALALPEFVTAQVTVSCVPGRTCEVLTVTSNGTRFGRVMTDTTENAAERAASSAREVWLSVLFGTSSATTQ